MSDTTKLNSNGFALDAIARGFTEEFLVTHVGNAVIGTWAAVTFIAAHLASGLKRDSVVQRLVRAGFTPDAVTDIIGTSDGGFSQRKGAIETLAHAGVDLSTAAAFDDEATRKRLQHVTWRATYDAREVVMAVGSGNEAWAALIAFTESNRATRDAMLANVRSRAASALQAAVEALPDDASETERKAAEQAAASAAEKAEKAAEKAEKSAAAAAARATGTASGKSTGATGAERNVAFPKGDYDVMLADLETFNGTHRGRGKGRKATLSEFIALCVNVARSHEYAMAETSETKVA